MQGPTTTISLFIFEFNYVQAGWIKGSVINTDGPVGGAEIISLLNGKTFISNTDGEYGFGFPEGEHEFDIILDGTYLDTRTIEIFPHTETEYDILFGMNGDISGDGVLNILDAVILINQILVGEYSQNSDLNNDGIVDLAVGSNTDDDGGDRRGAVWIVFLDNTGKVKDYQKISNYQGAFEDNILFNFFKIVKEWILKIIS